MPECPQCGAEISENTAFCRECGARLKEGVERQTTKKRLGSLVAGQHQKNIRSARTAIMVVAVITLIASIVFWFLLQDQIKSVKANPQLVLDEDAVSQQQISILATALLGVVFIVLFFWAKTNPFAATLVSLILYVTSHLVTIAINPAAISQGIIVKVIVIVFLISGVRSGLAYKRYAQETRT